MVKSTVSEGEDDRREPSCPGKKCLRQGGLSSAILPPPSAAVVFVNFLVLPLSLASQFPLPPGFHFPSLPCHSQAQGPLTCSSTQGLSGAGDSGSAALPLPVGLRAVGSTAAERARPGPQELQRANLGQGDRRSSLCKDILPLSPASCVETPLRPGPEWQRHKARTQ